MRVVLVPSVHSLEPATVDRDHGLGEQVQPSAKHYELAAGCPDRWPVVLAEICDGLEIRHEASGTLNCHVSPFSHALGGSRPLPCVPAKVGLLNPKPALDPGDGDCSSCPEADLRGNANYRVSGRETICGCPICRTGRNCSGRQHLMSTSCGKIWRERGSAAMARATATIPSVSHPCSDWEGEGKGDALDRRRCRRSGRQSRLVLACSRPRRAPEWHRIPSDAAQLKKGHGESLASRGQNNLTSSPLAHARRVLDRRAAIRDSGFVPCDGATLDQREKFSPVTGRL